MHLRAHAIISILAAFQFCPGVAIAAPHSSATRPTDGLESQSIALNGKTVLLNGKSKISTGPTPQNITFAFGQATNTTTRAPIRVRYKLDGFDSTWHEGGGEMFFLLRFYNEAGDAIGQKSFSAFGD